MRAESQIAAQLQNQHAFEVQQRQHAAAGSNNGTINRRSLPISGRRLTP